MGLIADDISVQDSTDSGRKIVIIEGANTNAPLQREIPLGAIAVRAELLGYSDPMEALDAVLHLQDHGVPDEDPATGRNCWDDPFTVLEEREHAREAEACRLMEAGSTSWEAMKAASDQAAYTAVHQPIDGGECLLDRVRRQARKEIGVPDPSESCGVETKNQPRQVMRRMARDTTGSKLQSIIESESEYLLSCTKSFLHSLSGYSRDPLADSPDQAGASRFAEIRTSYDPATGQEDSR